MLLFGKGSPGGATNQHLYGRHSRSDAVPEPGSLSLLAISIRAELTRLIRQRA